MKRKLFTLLTLLLTVCSGAWGDDFVLSYDTKTSSNEYNPISFTSNELTFTVNDGSDKAAGAGNNKTEKYRRNKTYTITVDASLNVSAIKFKGYTNSNTGDEYITKINDADPKRDGVTVSSLSSEVFPNKSTDAADYPEYTYDATKDGSNQIKFTTSNGSNQACLIITIVGTITDVVKPTFSLTNPAATSDVAISSRTVVLTASEAISKVDTDVSGTLKIGTADATAINYVYDGSANTLSYTFSGDLGYSTTYAFTVNANQVQDAAGNKNDATSAFSFTTEANVPAVITSVTPNGGAVNGGASVSVDADGTVYHQWSDNSTATVGVGEWSTNVITVPNEAGTKYLHVYAFKTAENFSAITTKEFTVTKVASVVTKVWDFTKALSATDIANLTEDSKWSSSELPGGETRWTGADEKWADKNTYISLTADDNNLEIVEGLSFARTSDLKGNFFRIDVGQRFQLNGSNGQIKIPSLNAGDVIEVNFASAGSSAGNRSLTASSNAYLSSAVGSNVSNINTDIKTAQFTATADGDVVLTNPDNGLNFFYIKVYQTVSVVEVPVTEYGWATFNCDQALDLTNVDFAYQVKGVSGSAVTLEAVNEPVAANTPLLIKGTEGTPVTLNIPITTSSNTLDDNKLVAVTANGTNVAKESGHWKYVLAVQDEKAVFAPINSDAANLNKGQAYLDLTEAPASARALSIGFNWDDETTGVQKIQSVESMANSCFNLAGQRVSKPMKGLYIVNGKKYLAK